MFILEASDDSNLYFSTHWCTLVLQIIKEHVCHWYIAWSIPKLSKISPFMQLRSCYSTPCPLKILVTVQSIKIQVEQLALEDTEFVKVL